MKSSRVECQTFPSRAKRQHNSNYSKIILDIYDTYAAVNGEIELATLRLQPPTSFMWVNHPFPQLFINKFGNTAPVYKCYAFFPSDLFLAAECQHGLALNQLGNCSQTARKLLPNCSVSSINPTRCFGSVVNSRNGPVMPISHPRTCSTISRSSFRIAATLPNIYIQ